MGFWNDMESRVKDVVGSEAGRKVATGFEGAVLETVKLVIEAALPGIVKTVAGGTIDRLAERGIADLEQLTSDELAKIHTSIVAPPPGAAPVVVGSDVGGAGTMRLSTEAPTNPGGVPPAPGGV